MSDEMEGRALMLYDGLCGVCNTAVQWVIKRDHDDRFRFAPQQSAVAAAILSRNGIDHEAMLDSNSVYLVLNAGTKQERLLTQSDVTVSMLMILGGRWRILGKVAARGAVVCAQCCLSHVRAESLSARRASMKFALYRRKRSG